MMADEDGATAVVRSPSHGQEDSSDDGIVDSISALPDVILQTILSSLPTKLAIRTCILSKRWRHVWCETPCLNLELYAPADSFNEALARYTARKMMSFHLCLISAYAKSPYIESWIEFAKSRNVENMTLDLRSRSSNTISYTMPDSLYINSSVKQLTLYLHFWDKIIPSSSVSWTSLKELFLDRCDLSYGSTLLNILSGCPVLESLTLHFCCCPNLKVFDLSKSLRLTRLEISYTSWRSGQIHIVAPQIHCLSLTVPHYCPCNLVDVSSLTQARLDIEAYSGEAYDDDFLQPIVQNLIEKLQNVDKLTFGENFIKILSLAEILHVPLPLFKFKALTFETMISHYVIPGIVKLLQSSSELKKLTVHIKDGGHDIRDQLLDGFLYEQLKPNKCFFLHQRQGHCWGLEARAFKNIVRENVESTHMASFMELVLKSTTTLENMVLKLGAYLEDIKFEELLEMVPVLSHNNNNVSIVLSSNLKKFILNMR